MQGFLKNMNSIRLIGFALMSEAAVKVRRNTEAEELSLPDIGRCVDAPVPEVRHAASVPQDATYEECFRKGYLPAADG